METAMRRMPAFALALCVLAQPPASALTLENVRRQSDATKTVLGQQTLRTGEMPNPTGWRVTARNARDSLDKAARCIAAESCRAQSLAERALSAARSQSGIERLATVNEIVNDADYRRDRQGEDLWSPIGELSRHGGDCEDFAAAKLFVLLKAGLPSKDMRIVVVDHAYREADHAVLEVDSKRGPVVLDSMTDAVFPSRKYRRIYEPKWALRIDEGAFRLQTVEMRRGD